MRAVQLIDRGVAEPIQLHDLPDPTPGEGEVLVRVGAASVNRVDIYMRDSGAGITHRLPQIVGVDGAGTVEACGPGVTGFTPGEGVAIYPGLTCGVCEFCRKGEPVLCTRMRILGEHVDGTMAEKVVVPAANLFHSPAGLSVEEVATLPTAYLTAWRMMVTKGQVKAGDSVLIFGGGGGVSLAAMQIGRLLGARTIVTSGHDDKLARARDLGADVTINHRTEDVVAAVMAATDKRGVDVVIENVGQASWGWAMRSVVRGGRIVVCGATSGGNPPADLQRLFIRQIQVIGSTLGNPEEFRDLLAFIERTGLRPVIDRRFPLEQAAEALRYLDAGGQFGKVVVTVP